MTKLILSPNGRERRAVTAQERVARARRRKDAEQQDADEKADRDALRAKLDLSEDASTGRLREVLRELVNLKLGADDGLLSR